jgi:hypothetical protein
MRAQFMGDPLYLQTDKYRAMPVELDEIKSVFRRVEIQEAPLQSLYRASLMHPACSVDLFHLTILGSFVSMAAVES